MKRNEVIQIRVSQEEKERLSKAAKAEGLSMSGLIRSALGFSDLGSTPAGRSHVTGVIDATETPETWQNKKLAKRIIELEGQGTSSQRAERQARKELGLQPLPSLPPGLGA